MATLLALALTATYGAWLRHALTRRPDEERALLAGGGDLWFRDMGEGLQRTEHGR